MADIKNITKTQAMAAQGLFSLAVHHQAKADEYYKAIQSLLDFEDSGNVSDAIWSDDVEAKIEPILKREGFRVVSD